MTSQQASGAAPAPPRVAPGLEAGGGAAEQADQSEGLTAAVECQEEIRPPSPACSPAAAPAPPHGFSPAATANIPKAGAMSEEDGAQPAPPDGRAGKHEPGQHLLRHVLTADVFTAAAAEFGSDKRAAGHAIWALKQPELRSTFARVYRFETRSSNNSWMRGKLLKAVGLDATWIPEQPETPQDEDPPRRDSSAVPEAEAAAAAAEADQGGAGRRPVRKAALAHRLWQTSEVEGDGKHPKQRRKRVQCAKRAAQGQPGARLVPPASRSPSAEASEGAAAGAASASASASALTEGLEQAASQGQGRTQGQGRKRQLPAQDAGAVQSPHPSKRPASPESAQSPAPPSAMAAAAFGIVPPVHAQQLAAAVFEAAAPWPSSGSGSTVQPLADAWPRMLAAAAYGAAPLQQQLGALPPHAFAAPGAASDPPTEAGLLQVLLQQQAQPSPAQLQPAQWAGWLAHGAPLPQLAAALPPGQLAMLGPVAPLGAAQQPAWGGRHQMPLMAVMSAGPPQPQPQEQLALQQLAAARLQQGQLQQHLEAQQRFEMRRQVEAQLRAAGLIAPGQLQAGVPIRLAALAPTAPAATVRPPTPHASQLQQAAMQPAGPPQSAMSPRRAAAHQMGGAVALLPPGWSVPTQQPWPAYTAGSSGSPAPGSADVQRFREQQLELERRAQQYQHEYNQAQQAQQAQHVQHPEQQQQRRRQQQQHQVPSPFAAYAAILPPDLQWQPQQAQAGGTAAATRDLAHPTVPHHTLSADLHMLFSAYADGQLSMPLPQGGPF